MLCLDTLTPRLHHCLFILSTFSISHFPPPVCHGNLCCSPFTNDGVPLLPEYFNLQIQTCLDRSYKLRSAAVFMVEEKVFSYVFPCKNMIN